MNCPNCHQRILKTHKSTFYRDTGLILTLITLLMLAGAVVEWLATTPILTLLKYLVIAAALTIIPAWNYLTTPRTLEKNQ